MSRATAANRVRGMVKLLKPRFSGTRKKLATIQNKQLRVSKNAPRGISWSGQKITRRSKAIAKKRGTSPGNVLPKGAAQVKYDKAHGKARTAPVQKKLKAMLASDRKFKVQAKRRWAKKSKVSKFASKLSDRVQKSVDKVWGKGEKATRKIKYKDQRSLIRRSKKTTGKVQKALVKYGKKLQNKDSVAVRFKGTKQRLIKARGSTFKGLLSRGRSKEMKKLRRQRTKTRIGKTLEEMGTKSNAEMTRQLAHARVRDRKRKLQSLVGLAGGMIG